MSRPSWVVDPGWPRAPKESADLCDAVADLIAVNGHHQGGLWPGNDWKPGQPVCLVGGLHVALAAYHARSGLTGSPSTPTIVHRDATAVIRRLAGVLSLTRWNDADGRTADEVIELLRRSGKELREMEGGGS